jgi:hypothetical protein
MRSRVERWLRGVAIAALLLAVWPAATLDRDDASLSAVGGSAELKRQFTEWTMSTRALRGHARFDSVPSGEVRDWLVALRRAGTDASWNAPDLAPIGVSLERVVDPVRRYRLWIAAPNGAAVVAGDSLGAFDSVVVRGAGAMLVTSELAGHGRARVGAATASAMARDSVVLRPVLLLGAAGWETKFLLAALEEHGWRTEARIVVSPKRVVLQGTGSIDTSRYSAVVISDSISAADATAVAAYVARGGGLVVTGNPVLPATLRALLPASPGALVPARPIAADSLRPRHTLALATLVRSVTGAVPLEGRDDRLAVVARRVGHGRVVQVGYVDTWRWRMGGGRDAERAHAEWWSQVIASVAYAPRLPVRAVESDPIPLASLVDQLGPQQAPGVTASRFSRAQLLALLFGIAVSALLMEITSRRLRGAP